tara:strand:+ start:224 stop:868 length:645 start_codon:yes stop_codon:yes gene_type:complete
MKYKHIIWDWNGTLLDDRWLCVAAINQTLSLRNMDIIDEEQYKEIFCFPVIEYYIKLGFDFNDEPFSIVGTEFIDFYNTNFRKARLHSNALQVLQSVLKSNRTQSILSAGKQSFLTKWVSDHGLSNFFIDILGIDNHYAAGKTELGRAWMEKLNYKHHEVVLVGDTIHDSEVAKEIGTDCILVNQGHVSYKRLQETGRVIFNGLEQAWRYINSM